MSINETGSRCCDNIGESYAAGPTACVAHPSVVSNIRKEIKDGRVLSLADARLAGLSGLVGIPAVNRSGFNDGVIYPPTAGAPALAMAGPAVAPTKRFSLHAPTGALTLNCLVLLVDFSDNVAHQTPAHFNQLLFDMNDPNSMASFYKELSYGKLKITGQVTNWIRAKHPYAHYTDGQSGTGNSFPKNTPGLLDEALQAYCKTGSLAGFDLNGDGFVDGLFLVHAGGGAEAEPDPNLRRDMIWSHKWTLPSPFTNSGIRAYAYFTAPEDGKLGVFSHEFGHFLGLPDLYDTSYRSAGIGDWCLMAGGSWNGGGNRPARMSAWCLANLGWIRPTNVSKASSLTLNALEKDKTACYRLPISGKANKEYFLIENRQKQGRDKDLPGSGLAVWHIDDTQSDNTNPLAYKVALVQADGKRELEFNRNEGNDGDLFPGSKKVTKVDGTGAGHPHLRANDGTATTVVISNIKLNNAVITADVKV
jgi:immune inhibitor A